MSKNVFRGIEYFQICSRNIQSLLSDKMAEPYIYTELNVAL